MQKKKIFKVQQAFCHSCCLWVSELASINLYSMPLSTIWPLDIYLYSSVVHITTMSETYNFWTANDNIHWLLCIENIIYILFCLIAFIVKLDKVNFLD